MAESIEDYKRRILGYVGNEDPLLLQKQTESKLGSLIQGKLPEKLLQRPLPDKWSVAEIVAHLADDELVGAYRIRLILSSPGTDIQSFDQAQWALQGRYNDIAIATSLALFSGLRNANLFLFSTLTPDQWMMYGIHAERGKETIQDIAKYYAGHDINHLKQIAAIIL